MAPRKKKQEEQNKVVWSSPQLSRFVNKQHIDEPEQEQEQEEYFEDENQFQELEISPEMLEMLMEQMHAKSLEPRWNVKIDGLSELESPCVKFTVLTSGESNCGQTVIDFVVKPGLNHQLQKWLVNPEERKVSIDVANNEGEQIDSIKFRARPIAVAVADLGDAESAGKPWITTIQLSVTDMTFSN